MNATDLSEFLKLAKSPICNQAREDALRAWDGYKQQRQLSAFLEERNAQSPANPFPNEVLTKGDTPA